MAWNLQPLRSGNEHVGHTGVAELEQLYNWNQRMTAFNCLYIAVPHSNSHYTCSQDMMQIRIPNYMMHNLQLVTSHAGLHAEYIGLWHLFLGFQYWPPLPRSSLRQPQLRFQGTALWVANTKCKEKFRAEILLHKYGLWSSVIENCNQISLWI